MKLTVTNTIALCIDLQEKLIPAMSHPDELVNRTSILVRGLTLHSVPVIVTRQYPKGLGDTVPEIRNALSHARTIDKLSFSCSDEPMIREALALPEPPASSSTSSISSTHKSISSPVAHIPTPLTPISSPECPPSRPWVLVCGVETHICVAQTVLDLLESGRSVGLVTDCIDSRRSGDHETAIRRMVQAGAIPMSCESVLFELTRHAGTDTFRQISRLVTGR
ncbi:MAG: isochorismatase family protein [Planctomycetia bacterium]|nr:isochorismatase family protein [Planctomycetia bacterium]